MAVETAMKFLERLEREETLRTQLYISRADNLEMFVQFAHSKGFVVSEEDMRTALREYQPRFKSGSIEPLRQLADQRRLPS